MRDRARTAAIRRVRRVRRGPAAGFTLVELMVVVAIISVLTVIASPQMSRARDDRLVFDYARRIEQLIHRGRARAAGRGAAHLFVAAPSGASRGRFLLFEALDGTLPAAAGPNPVSSCKRAGQWTDAGTFVPGTVSNNAGIVDGFDLDSGGINVDADIRTAFFLSVNNAAAAAATVMVMCTSPSGSTFVGQGASIPLAVADMQAQTTSFNSFLEVRVTRSTGGTQAGLTRRVMVAGGAAPRIKSE